MLTTEKENSLSLSLSTQCGKLRKTEPCPRPYGKAGKACVLCISSKRSVCLTIGPFHKQLPKTTKGNKKKPPQMDLYDIEI